MIKDEDIDVIFKEMMDHFGLTEDDLIEEARLSNKKSFAARITVLDDLAEELGYDLSRYMQG